MYKDSDTDPYVVTHRITSGTVTAEETEELKDLPSGLDGVFWVGELPYGTYYIHEESEPIGWFTLTVDADTVENGNIISGIEISAWRQNR